MFGKNMSAVIIMNLVFYNVLGASREYLLLGPCATDYITLASSPTAPGNRMLFSR
jgi:hypothetical protein